MKCHVKNSWQNTTDQHAAAQRLNRGCLLLKLLCGCQDSGHLSLNGFLLENASDDIGVIRKIKSKIPPLQRRAQ